MSVSRAWVVGAVVSVCLLGVSADVLAAGADGSWAPARCSAGSLSPGSGSTLYVSPGATDPLSGCPGTTFKTLDGALKCAAGGSTIYVRGNAGLFPAQQIHDHYFSTPVLVTNYPGESPTFDGTLVANPQREAILDIWNVSNISFQGLTVQNTGISTCSDTHGFTGIKVSLADHIKLWNNTIQQTWKHGMRIAGKSISIIGNRVTQTVLRNQNEACDNAGGNHDSAISVGPDVTKSTDRNSYDIDVINNDVHDNWGECILLSDTDTGRVNGNRVFNCVQVDIYVNKAQNVVVARNWVDHWSSAFNYGGKPAQGIALINENVAGNGTNYDGYSLHNIEVSSNIIENVWMGIHYARYTGTDPGITDTYSDLHFIFNDISRTNQSAIKVDRPKSGVFSGSNSVRRNVVYQTAPDQWLLLDSTTNWDYGLTNEKHTTPSGIASIWTDPNGSDQSAYLVIPGSYVINKVQQSSEPRIPTNDYYCAQRPGHTTSTPGAHEYGW